MKGFPWFFCEPFPMVFKVFLPVAGMNFCAWSEAETNRHQIGRTPYDGSRNGEYSWIKKHLRQAKTVTDPHPVVSPGC